MEANLPDEGYELKEMAEEEPHPKRPKAAAAAAISDWDVERHTLWVELTELKLFQVLVAMMGDKESAINFQWTPEHLVLLAQPCSYTMYIIAQIAPGFFESYHGADASKIWVVGDSDWTQCLTSLLNLNASSMRIFHVRGEVGLHVDGVGALRSETVLPEQTTEPTGPDSNVDQPYPVEVEVERELLQRVLKSIQKDTLGIEWDGAQQALVFSHEESRVVLQVKAAPASVPHGLKGHYTRAHLERVVAKGGAHLTSVKIAWDPHFPLRLTVCMGPHISVRAFIPQRDNEAL